MDKLPSDAKPYSILVNNYPKKVHTKVQFGVEMMFALTMDKAQGQTLDRVVLAISEPSLPRKNMTTFARMLVALSRVRNAKDIRWLLHIPDSTTTEDDIYKPLEYLTKLKPNKYVSSFYYGLSENNGKWNHVESLKFLKSYNKKE